MEGELPSVEQREQFVQKVAALRRIPEDVSRLLPEVARLPAAPPLSAERIGMSLVSAALQLRPALDCSPQELRDRCLQLCALAPSVVAAVHRLRSGRAVIEPAEHLGHAADYLFMLNGEEADGDRASALEQYWIATIDHGFNASTFTARIIASTRADIGAAVVGAMGALSGPLHDGAPGRVWEMLDEIGTRDRADAWLRARLERGERIMGFGHAVYRTEDPRSRLLRAVAERLGGPRVELAQHVEGAEPPTSAGAQAGPRAVHERGVLRVDRARGGGSADGALHPDVRPQPDGWVVRSHHGAARGSPDHAADGAIRGAPAREPGASLTY